uniref:cytochrome c oxidase subunit 7B, mitochondrial n=1 Tax=Jaculus jaculus TaxID=51337 RepID=UPI000332F4E7|nr:cytochrome c oxidase subunit 7B, mitochondrial [Jaculus jaculus]
MISLARSALSSLQTRSVQQMMVRWSHTKQNQDFHDKYGNAVLTSGFFFCVVTFGFYITQMGVKWNLSPVGRVTPKRWNYD